MRIFLIIVACILPSVMFSQVYRYTKEVRIEYNDKDRTDTVYIVENEVRIEIQVMKNHITITRPRNGSGEPLNIEVYTIKKITKDNRNAKITTKEGCVFNIYPASGIRVRCQNDSKHIDYSFGSPSNMKFRYE